MASFATLSLALVPLATGLDTVVVESQATCARLTDFEKRRKSGIGHFLTEAEIEKHNSVFVGDLLRTMPSVKIMPIGRVPFAEAAYSMRGSNACPYQIFSDLPSPKDLAGIEIYSGAATVPLEFKRPDTTCGVILLWTKE